MRDNVDDNKKEHLKNDHKQWRKAKCKNFDNNEKEQLRKYDKKWKKIIRITSMIKNRTSENYDNKRKKLKIKILRMMKKNSLKIDDRKKNDEQMFKNFRWKKSFFNNAQIWTMADPCTLTTPTFRLTEEGFIGALQKWPTYICDNCWMFEFWKNVMKLKERKHRTDIY